MCSTSWTHWQARFLDALGRRLVFAADEYSLLAGRPFPPLDHYDDLAQHENGIGMASEFAAEVASALAGDAVDAMGTRTGFFAWVDGAPAEGYRAPRLDRAPDAARRALPRARRRTSRPSPSSPASTARRCSALSPSSSRRPPARRFA